MVENFIGFCDYRHEEVEGCGKYLRKPNRMNADRVNLCDIWIQTRCLEKENCECTECRENGGDKQYFHSPGE